MDDQVFLEEAAEILEQLTGVLLDLEQSPSEQELVNKAFRAFHTIKGSASMFGYSEISAFVHEAETLLDQVRGGRLAMSKEIIDLDLAALDIIRDLLPGANNPADPARQAELVANFRRLSGNAAGKEKTKTPPPAAAKTETIYRLRWRPAPDFLARGSDPLKLLREIRALGPCRITAQTCHLPELAKMDVATSYLAWDLILTTNRGREAISELFHPVATPGELTIEVIDEVTGSEGELPYKKLGEILVERGDIAPAAIDQTLAKQQRLGDLLVTEGLVEKTKIAAALAEQQVVREVRQKRSQDQALSSIRIAAEKIDGLVNLVGEVITAQAQLSQIARLRRDPGLSNIAEVIERLISSLRENTMSMRMLPIETIFGKFRRVVRDLAKELGKEAQLITLGSDTELDKTLLEQLTDPLMHLIRNCVDHGLESPEARRAAGKKSSGTIVLSARHSGDHVTITVEDDGKGLNPQAIRQKAVTLGLIAADAALSEPALLNLIFAPGFSLAAKVTSVSGRGVGMDVVKRNLEGLQGTIEIDSRLGLSTKIILRVPLTLAIIEGLVVETGEDRYIIPLASVQECHEQTRAEVELGHGNQILKVRGQMIPYICLRQRFAIPGELPAVRRIVLCEANDKQIGIAVDKVIGSQQTVIKPLGEVYKGIDCLSGATILGDGSVALILNPAKMLRKMREERRE